MRPLLVLAILAAPLLLVYLYWLSSSKRRGRTIEMAEYRFVAPDCQDFGGRPWRALVPGVTMDPVVRMMATSLGVKVGDQITEAAIDAMAVALEKLVADRSRALRVVRDLPERARMLESEWAKRGDAMDAAFRARGDTRTATRTVLVRIVVYP